ncbi:RNA dependent RNA polymerase [Plasmopara viticola lesion associated ourmia-like virus 4]|uniref:RNA dependent RNA polymerase n=1 Tax=Plasmopara viticola lesion associated ourmia-like virus 4 TaxID=2686509 RepID=A0ABX6FM39_9VIRU|nr:RNA dependent RNA polymerase [Plasmopara viticola lesion associated ourmia-like virus 4]QGY72534.1 RNA dependent RNA polymerase [Plasmopara viticola lesion associated ourmia-like virus 4]
MSPAVLGKRALPCDSPERRRPCWEQRGWRAATCSLKLLSQTMVRELQFPRELFSPSKSSCEELQRAWKLYCSGGRSEKEEYSLAAYAKASRGIFDFYCHACEEGRKAAALRAWSEKMLSGAVGTTETSILNDIKERVRRLLSTKTTDYWSSWEGEKDSRVRIPDLNACFERRVADGGTFSVSKSCCLNPQGEFAGAVRADAVLTKGKHRVVTMQPAVVKRLLDPCMCAAYDWISSQSWCVRGDIGVDDYATIHGEGVYVSGDYSSATDNLHLDAVQAVVDVLASFLPPREADLLRRSFSPLLWTGGRVYGTEGINEIRSRPTWERVIRGSMMGSKFSFVVLCLLNRVSFDRAAGVKTYRSPGYGNDGVPVLCNGDDIAYNDERDGSLYERWLQSVREVGFVVNEQKTKRSRTFVELNSSPINMTTLKMLPRPSFGLLSARSEGPLSEWYVPDWNSCLEASNHLSWSTWTWFMSQTPVVRRLEMSEVAPALFSRRQWRFFVKKKWFRRRVATSIEERTKNPLPMTKGPILCKTDEDTVCSLEREFRRWYIRERLGDNMSYLNRRVRCERPRGRAPMRIERVQRWTVHRMWITPVLEFWKRKLAEPSLAPQSSWEGVLYPPQTEFDHPVPGSSRTFYVSRSAEHGPTLDSGWTRSVGTEGVVMRLYGA